MRPPILAEACSRTYDEHTRGNRILDQDATRLRVDALRIWKRADRFRYAEFFWQSKEGPAGGVVTLIDQSQEEVDPAWVRAVCRSLSCTGESCSRPRSKEEVEAQFEIIAE